MLTAPARLLPLLAAAMLCPELGAQSSGRSHDHQAQGAGDGDFVIDLDTWLPPFGARIAGAEDPGITPEAIVFYAELGHGDGLVRSNRRMDILANQAGSAAQALLAAQAAGMRSLFTCVGTPRNNATGDPPGEEWHTLPGYARTPPADLQLWADNLVAMLAEMQRDFGVLPDFVEIWNEPEREEWWVGTFEQYLALYRAASKAVKAAFPQIRVGGAGFASSEGVAGAYTMPEALMLYAAQAGAPLDFVSWHHYVPANELRYRDTTAHLRRFAGNSGLPAVPLLLVSEWSLYPNGGENNPFALELDGAPAATQIAGFLTSAIETALDGNCFFMTQDVEGGNQFAVFDLTGAGNGLFTHRGVKKPAYRILEFLYPMAREPRARVTYPGNEWAVSLLATRRADGRVRLVLANDTLSAQWVWANACRERGGEPGVLWNATELLLDLGLPVTLFNLVRYGGLEPEQAQIVLEVVPLAEDAQWIESRPRVLRIEVRGGTLVPAVAWQFDDGHNAPAADRDALLPLLEAVEADAQAAAWSAAEAYFAADGVDLPNPANVDRWPASPAELAAWLGTSLAVAEGGWVLFYQTLEAERLAQRAWLNDQPTTRLQTSTPAGAGVTREGNVLTVTLPQNTTLVLECEQTNYQTP